LLPERDVACDTCASGSLLRQAGVPNADIAKLMGHADTKMVDRVYGQMRPESLAAALRRSLGGTKPARFARIRLFFARDARKKAGAFNP
jgi:hypothetical protein